jgi:carboxylesterase type B
MINTNLDEGAFFVRSKLKADNEDVRQIFIRRVLPYYTDEEMAALNKLYSSFEGSNSELGDVDRVIRILSDYYFHCPSRKMAVAFNSSGLPVIKSFFAQRIALLQPGLKLPVIHGS